MKSKEKCLENNFIRRFLIEIYYLFFLIFILNGIDNRIGDDGAKAIGKALEVNRTLTNLDLQSMFIDSLFIYY